MKRAFNYIILILICLITTNVYADDYSTGDSGLINNLGEGKWKTAAVGMKVSIVSDSGKVKKTLFFRNGTSPASNVKFSSDSNPKIYQSNSIKWERESKDVTMYKLKFLPKKWTTGTGKKIQNLYDILSKNDYKNLKEIIEDYLKKDTEDGFKNGDYLLIEPMTIINDQYGTAFEFANYYNIIDESLCKSAKSFCWNYVGAVFSGSEKRSDGGVFYHTLSLIKPVLGMNPFSSNNYFDRRRCLMDSKCGRGIGVWRYPDIYGCEDCDDEEQPETGLTVSVGCLTASITDNNFQTSGNTSCTTTVELRNNISGLTNIGSYIFYAKAGRFLLRKEGTSIIVNNDTYNPKPMIIAANGIATATITKNCTIEKSTSETYQFESATSKDKPTFGISFNNLDQINDEISNSFSVAPQYKNTWATKTCPKCVSYSYDEDGDSYCAKWSYPDCEWTHTYTYSQTYNFDYNLPSVYLDRITGQAFDSGSVNTKGEIKGIISKLTDSNGMIPFNIKYNGIVYEPYHDPNDFNNSKACIYQLKQEIIKKPPDSDLTDLQLEFRTVDSNNPFNRNTKSNWCGTSGGTTDCTQENNVVENFIINRPNSYGRKEGVKEDPKYTIELDIESIKYIRNYNSTHGYDQNDMNEVKNFLTDITGDILEGYTP